MVSVPVQSAKATRMRHPVSDLGEALSQERPPFFTTLQMCCARLGKTRPQPQPGYASVRSSCPHPGSLRCNDDPFQLASD